MMEYLINILPEWTVFNVFRRFSAGIDYGTMLVNRKVMMTFYDFL